MRELKKLFYNIKTFSPTRIQPVDPHQHHNIYFYVYIFSTYSDIREN